MQSGDVYVVRVQRELRFEKELRNGIDIPDLNCISEDEGESGESGKEQKSVRASDPIWNG